MSSEKRLVLFMALTFFSFLAIEFVMEKTGLKPPPPKPQAKQDQKPEGGKAAVAAKPGPAEAVADKDKDKGKGKAQAKGKGEDGAKPAPEKAKPEFAVVKPSELILGSGHDRTPKGYRLEVRLEQNGAGVDSVASSRYDADKEGRRLPKVPLDLIRHDPTALPSLALSLQKPPGDNAAAEPPAEDGIVAIPDAGDIPLGEVLWEVVRDPKGRAVRPVTKVDPATKEKVEGQEVLFRYVVDELKVTLTKRFRLWKGEDGFEFDLGFASPEKARSLVYRLYGPHGIPIEGEWYTGTFRDVFFGQVRGKSTEIVTKPASEIAKPKAARFDNTALPLAFAGIENQYFAVFVEPVPAPTTDEQRWDRETFATVVDVKPDAPQKADLSFEILSKPVQVGPNQPVTQTYRVYAGPKTQDALAPFGAAQLASYRKYQWFGIPGAAWMSMNVIAPLLDHIYTFTARVAALFGGKSGGNYGVAIILLTLLVRMIMFPLGRKQALAAKKMQDLQPLLKEIQEKYKDDKERQTRETLGLYKKHGVNPVGGCLPALIQLPIFVGLWQALNNSVHLRHASFLFIKNLAAPDMLFRFPTQLPLLGDYFNLLPFLVVSLMLVQTKLFAPPATTPEAEMQQKMMKYMMVFMGFMFYKVPSGLGIYFITSSTWQICERLLLPKVTHNVPQSGDDVGDEKSPPGGGRGGNNPPPGGGRGGNGPGGRGGNGAPPKPQGKLAQFWERVKEEAAKDTTYRNLMDEREKKEKDKDKGKPRTRPGRRR